MIMEMPSIQSILSEYNDAESRHILNFFPLASLFTRKEKSDNKKLIECYPDSAMGFPGGLCYKIHYFLDVSEFHEKYPTIREYMERFGKSVAIELGSKVDDSVARALDNNTKHKSLAKAFDMDEVIDAAESVFLQNGNHVGDVIGIAPDGLRYDEDFLEMVKGFYVEKEKAINSWQLGMQAIEERGNFNIHWYSSSFVNRGYVLDKNAVEIVFGRFPPALPLLSDIFVDKKSGFSKRKSYGNNLCQPEKILQDDMQFRVYADFSRIRSFSCIS
jgi:hypothetical protein